MQNKYNKCPNCMKPINYNDVFCPHCGFNIGEYKEITHGLKPFTVLKDKYLIGRVIGVGGFGITYIGWDMMLETYIAIKEYFPESFASRTATVSETQVIPNESTKASYDKGLTRYLEEARNLSRFYQLQGIVSVKDFFYENGTGYIVMEYIDGINLKEYLKNMGGRLPEHTVLSLMKPVLESLSEIHSSGLIHRDISPDNVMVDKKNRIKLIDFGSARGQSADGDKTFTVILKHGYAPPEQYHAKGNQGPWTDIYSLCATMYRMLTGQNPPNSIERLENDEYVPVSAWGVNVSDRTEYVLRKGLAVKSSDRYQNISQFMNELYSTQPFNSATPTYQNSGMYNYGNTSEPSTPSNYSYAPTYQEEPKKNKLGIIIGVISVLVILLVVGLVLIFSGGDKEGKKETTTEKVTTEKKTTEEKTTEEKTTENTTEDTTEETTENTTESVEDEVTIETFNGVTYGVPAGFEYSADISDNISIGYYHENLQTAFMVTVYSNDMGDVESVQSVYDTEIKAAFGSACIGYDVEYNGYTGMEWDISNVEEGYGGYSLLFCDEETIVYVEYITYDYEFSPYYDVVFEITY